MKKILLTLGLIATSLISWFFYTKPEPPFGADPINTEISSVFNKIQNYEDSIFQTEGKYIQFLSDGLNRDGSGKVTWNKSIKPNDMNYDWSTISGLPTSSYLTYRVDIYGSGKGQGYTITAEYKGLDGDYKYFKHFGPETYRDSGEGVLITPAPKPSVVATISHGI